jgi:ATP-dependent Clp protease adapter protein ClpS
MIKNGKPEGDGRRATGDGRETRSANHRPTPFALRPTLNAVVSPYEDEDVLVDDDIGTRIGEPWKVVLYNDDIHTFDEVILQLQKAIGCSVQRAEQIAFEAHTKGKAVAFSGEFNECYRVMGVLREIQLVVEIEG